jgi:hypothetical protein
VDRQGKFRSSTHRPIVHRQTHHQSHQQSHQLASRLDASQLGIAGAMMVLDSQATWPPTKSPTMITTQPPTKHPSLTLTSSPTTKPSSTPTGTSGLKPCQLRFVSSSQLRLGLRSLLVRLSLKSSLVPGSYARSAPPMERSRSSRLASVFEVTYRKVSSKPTPPSCSGAQFESSWSCP